MIVINHVIYKGNPYHKALYASIGDRYKAERGDVDSAIRLLKSGESRLLHVHWEEHSIRGCRTPSEASAVADYFLRRAAHFVKAGGRLLWTVHNLGAHESVDMKAFLSIRQGLADLSDRILVHNTEAIAVLGEQIRLPLEKIFHLPHPSYLGFYPSEASAEVRPREALFFGMVRKYKGLERLLEAFATIPAEKQLSLRVAGEAFEGPEYADELKNRYAAYPQIQFDFRRVPDEEVAVLLKAAGCLVLPYERFLTSGVAMLALGFGTPIVAPAAPQMLELLPAVAHRLLFTPGDTDDLARAVERALSLSPEEREELAAAYKARAEEFHPAKISTLLGRLYDDLLGETVAVAS